MNPSLLARLEHQADALQRLLKGLTENQIRQQPLPGKWSVFETIAHLGRYQEVFLDRMAVLRQQEKPGFGRYVAEEDAGFSEWTTRSYEDLLRDFRSGRNAILQVVRTLPADQLQRVGFHPVYGAMTVEGWMEFFLLHEAHHFLTILKLAGQLRPSGLAVG
ncbi:hypothetical protein GCM10027299_35390 [Larkinella ripae]